MRALIGFLLALSPLSAELMGWRGTGAAPAVGSADIGIYFFFGGLLMILGSVGEVRSHLLWRCHCLHTSSLFSGTRSLLLSLEASVSS
jgi:hypothetical protein